MKLHCLPIYLDISGAIGQEKAELYEQLAELNRQIRAERKKLALCRKIQNSLPRMEQETEKVEARESEVRTNEHRRR